MGRAGHHDRMGTRITLAAALFLGLCATALATEPGWEKERTQDGLTVYTKAREGRALPLVKAEGLIPENMYEILAVLNDVERHTQWMAKMRESTLVSRRDDFNLRLYQIFDAPWPVTDRDAVLLVHVEYDRERQRIGVHFRNVRTHPHAPGLVRLPQLDIMVRLRFAGPHKTWVRYQMDVDPGGQIPNWVMRWILRRLPFRTLEKLRKQVQRTRGKYSLFLDKWDPNRKMKAPDEGSIGPPG